VRVCLTFVWPFWLASKDEIDGEDKDDNGKRVAHVKICYQLGGTESERAREQRPDSQKELVLYVFSLS